MQREAQRQQRSKKAECPPDIASRADSCHDAPIARITGDDPRIPAGWFLPEGLHMASEADVTFRFGSSSPRRRRLALRLRRWIELARQVNARRLLIDGSFITAKPEPNDIDAVILLPENFQEQTEREIESAMELEQMLLTRHPEEIFAAEDDADWDDWLEFFARTREADGRRKGIVEIAL
jgi:hypothetical protein